MLKAIAAISMLILTVACTPGRYLSAEGKPAPERDVQECAYEAEKATASATDPNPLAGPTGGLYALTNNSEFRKARLEQSCMKLRGYTMQ